MVRATQTGRALTPAQSRRAVNRYGFLAANAIELGLRKLAENRLSEQLGRTGSLAHSADIHPVHASLGERVSGMGFIPDAGALGRAVNLVTSVPREAAAIGIGLGQLAGRGGYDFTVDLKNAILHPHDPVFQHTRETATALAHGIAADYQARYGPGFEEELQKRGPLPWLLDLTMAAGAVTRAGSVARGAAEARGAGLSPLEAIRQGYRKSFSPIDQRLAVPGHARTLPLGEQNVPLSWSRSPMGRHFQRMYDDYSLTHPDQPRVGSNPRAAKRIVRLERQGERRQRVAQARGMSFIRHPANRFRGNKAADIRLFWEANLPPEFRTNEGLQAIRTHLERLQSSPARVRELEPTARLVEARARHAKLLDRYEKSVGKNKQRIRKEVDKAGADVRSAEDSYAVMSQRKSEFEQDPTGVYTKAKARIEKIDADHEKLISAIEADMKQAMGGKFDPAETMRRTKYKREATGAAGKRAQARAKLEETRTQKQQLRDDAWAKLEQTIRDHPDNPHLQQISKEIDERNALQNIVDTYEERYLFEKPPTPEKGPQHENIPANLGRGKYRAEASRLGGATSVAADELQALERRHLTRIGQSTEQLQKNLVELRKRIHRSGEGTKTRAALEERAQKIQATIDAGTQYTQARGYLTHEMLGRRIEELDKAMQHTPDDRYHAALAAAEAMTADLEKISSTVLGPDKVDELLQTFEQRRGLLGRMVGLPEDAGASTIFAPHREERTTGRIKDTSGIGAPRKRRISGKTSTQQLGLNRRNRGILVETGRVDPNLDHLIVQWGRAQSWRFVQNIRDILYGAGDEIPVGSSPRPGWYVVDRNSRANPQLWDNAELGSDEALHAGLEDFVNNSIMRGEDADPAMYENMRQVDPSIVDAVFREAGVDLPGKTGRLRQSLETGGAPFDVVNGLVRTSILYANPGYYPANFIGNLIFMGLHQGAFALPNIYEAGNTYFKNRHLFDLISGEVGMGPTEALSARTAAGGRLDAALNLERRVTHTAAAIPDVWPRVAAWMFEAKNAGFKTADQMEELISGGSERLNQLRQQVSDRSTEAMVNFERTSPLERATLGRVFFVWPWIRGASSWATRYAREYPERTGVLAPVAYQEHQQDKRPYEPLGVPAYLENLVPLNKVGSRVLNVGSVSPSATAAQLVQTFAGTVNAMVSDVPPPKYNGLGDMINPMIDFAWYTLHSQTTLGKDVGLREAVIENSLTLSPLTSTILQATGRQKISNIYTDQSAIGTFERRWGRVFPFPVSPQAIAERAKQDQPGPSETPQSRMDEYLQSVKTLIGDPPESIRRARRNQMLYEQATEEYKKRKYGSSRHSLTNREEAAVLLGVDASQRPAVWDPASLQKMQAIIRDGPPASVDSFISHDKQMLWGQILEPLGTRLAAARRAKEARDYARTHGG